MKKIAYIALFFLTGIIISWFLGDLIEVISGSAGKLTAARDISAAQEYYAGGNYSQALDEYKKALDKISPSDKKLLAKVKNNMALCVFQTAFDNKDVKGMRDSLPLFEESLALYKEVGDTESAQQVETNIAEAKKQIK